MYEELESKVPYIHPAKLIVQVSVILKPHLGKPSIIIYESRSVHEHQRLINPENKLDWSGFSY
jgi:hypothetical protein